MSLPIPKPIRLSANESEQVRALLAVNHTADALPTLYEWCGRVRYLLTAINARQDEAGFTPAPVVP